MGEYQATITYMRPRHFGSGADGAVVPSGETMRFGGELVVAYVRPEAASDVRPDAPFEGRVLFMSRIEQEHPFEPGQELEIVMPGSEAMQVIGRCVVREKVG